MSVDTRCGVILFIVFYCLHVAFQNDWSSCAVWIIESLKIFGSYRYRILERSLQRLL